MYNASKLFDKNGELFSNDRAEIGAAIVETDAIASSSEHEAKLARIEIGLAIRAVAGLDRVTLTDTISNLNLCKTYDRSEKTFLKYARIAGVNKLLVLATDPAVSISVLDEIAASKKPIDPIQRAEFLKRLCDGVRTRNETIRKEEGLGDTGPDKLRAPGISRNGMIRMIRETQVEFAVPTRAVTPSGGPKERNAIKHRKMLSRVSRLVRLSNCAQIMLLPEEDREEWQERENLSWADIAKSYASTREKLVDDGILKPSPIELTAGSIVPSASLLKAELAAAMGSNLPTGSELVELDDEDEDEDGKEAA